VAIAVPRLQHNLQGFVARAAVVVMASCLSAKNNLFERIGLCRLLGQKSGRCALPQCLKFAQESFVLTLRTGQVGPQLTQVMFSGAQFRFNEVAIAATRCWPEHPQTNQERDGPAHGDPPLSE
jgi:hypothetical protein